MSQPVFGDRFNLDMDKFRTSEKTRPTPPRVQRHDSDIYLKVGGPDADPDDKAGVRVDVNVGGVIPRLAGQEDLDKNYFDRDAVYDVAAGLKRQLTKIGKSDEKPFVYFADDQEDLAMLRNVMSLFLLGKPVRVSPRVIKR